MARHPDHPESSDAGQQAKSEAEQADSDVSGQVQEKVDQETEQGYRGVEVDPTPNENYTAEGVTSGAPTPETDPEAAAEAEKAIKQTNLQAEGLAAPANQADQQQRDRQREQQEQQNKDANRR